MKFKTLVVFLLIISSALTLKADSVDSLKNKLNSTEKEYDKIPILYTLSGYTSQLNIDSSLCYAKEGLLLAEKYKDSSLIAEGYSAIGQAYHLGSLGKALENYLIAVNICKKTGNKTLLVEVLNRIGILYLLNEDYINAKQYVNLAYDNARKYNDTYGCAFSLLILGGMCDFQNDFLNALKLIKESQKISYIPMTEVYLGIAYLGLDSIEQSFDHASKILEFYKKDNDNNGQGEAYKLLGKIYSRKKNYSQSIDAFQKSLFHFKLLNSTPDIRDVNYLLFQQYQLTKQYNKALECYIIYADMKIDYIKKSNLDEIQYKYENKIKDLENQKNQLLQNELIYKQEQENKRQRFIIFSFIAGFIVILFFSIIIFRLFMQKKKANVILARQKEEILMQRDEITGQRDEIEAQRDMVVTQNMIIENKNKNITDSIRYAQRIQQAILPMDEKLQKLLQNYFVFYQPKDIVSGDFYWTENITDTSNHSITLFAAVDCTGHGVPGAFMSLLGYNGLSQAVKENKLDKPGEILNFLSKYIRDMLRQRKEERNVKDGMDLFLCALDRSTLKLAYAGVHNAAYLIRKKEIIILKSDKHPIAEPFDNEFVSYSNNEIALHPGDTLYLFTDGYIDQFGGKDHKKFMSKRFRELLLEIQSLTMTEQQNRLSEVFEEWKGSYEQYDDVLVMGLKIC